MRGSTRLLPLAIGTFAVGTDAFVIAGILPGIARELHISQSAAGQLVTLFAIAYAVGSPILSVLAAPLPRRGVLLLGLSIFTIANLASAVSPGYTVLAVTRICAACGAGLYTPNASAAAVASVSPHRRGAALALVFGGLTAADVLGVPLGTFLGSAFGWRATLLFVALLGILAGVGVAVLLRELPPSTATSMDARICLVGDRGVLGALLVIVVAMAGGFTFYTYIAAILDAIAGGHVAAHDLTYFLLVAGVSGVAGGRLGGWLADRFRSGAVLTASLVAMAAGLLLFPLLASSFTGVVVAMVLYGLTGTLITVPNQHRLVSLAPGAVPEVMSLNASALYLGIALAGVVGGALLSTFGAAALPFAAGCTVLLGLLLHVLTRGAQAVGPATWSTSGPT